MGRRVVALIGLVLMGSLALVPTLAAEGEAASGAIINGTGQRIGTVELIQRATGVNVYVRIDNAQYMQPGTYGIHFHAVGRCDPPDFTSAGGHFNPTGAQHGAKNPQGPHAGDLPNLTLDDRARAEVSGFGYGWSRATNLITLTPGPTNLLDADGAALVIHANADDELTDPTGNSGGRIACAVLQRAPGLPNTGLGGAASAQNARGLAAAIGLGALVIAVAANAAALRRPRRG